MAEASKLPPDPFAGWVEVVEPDPARWWRAWVGVVRAAGRSQRLVSVTGVALRRCSGGGG
jgi:hypothetical protein